MNNTRPGFAATLLTVCIFCPTDLSPTLFHLPIVCTLWGQATREPERLPHANPLWPLSLMCHIGSCRNAHIFFSQGSFGSARQLDPAMREQLARAREAFLKEKQHRQEQQRQRLQDEERMAHAKMEEEEESEGAIAATPEGLVAEFRAPSLPAGVACTAAAGVALQADHAAVSGGCALLVPMDYLQANHGRLVNAYTVSLRVSPAHGAEGPLALLAFPRAGEAAGAPQVVLWPSGAVGLFRCGPGRGPGPEGGRLPPGEWALLSLVHTISPKPKFLCYKNGDFWMELEVVMSARVALSARAGGGGGRPVDRGVWTAKTVKRPRQQPAHPQYANYWALLTRKRHTTSHSA